MSRCWCRFALAVLVIVFAWWDPSWAKYALTVLGGLLALGALGGGCCCAALCKTGKPESKSEEQSTSEQETAD